MRHASFGLAILLWCGWLLPAHLGAQYPKRPKEPPASLGGEVVSAKGAPVSRAAVLYQASDGRTPRVVHTDAEGHFRIAEIRAGLYDLRAVKGKGQSEWSHNFLVRPGQQTSVTLRLAVETPPPAPPK
jgi:Carboxypeptidase regulatory-like domain